MNDKIILQSLILLLQDSIITHKSAIEEIKYSKDYDDRPYFSTKGLRSLEDLIDLREECIGLLEKELEKLK